jgi:DNA-binding NarL/FixJ family response regulator
MSLPPRPPENPPASPGVAVFLADDHKIVRDGLRVLFEKSGGLRVVGDAGDGRALVEGVLALRPEVVVTDMSMGELNGIDAVRQLRAAGYQGAIVMLSMHDERRVIAQALEAGVNGYIHKDHAFDQVLEAIAAARRGEVWLSPQLRALAEGGLVPTILDVLTMREREVLQLFAEGYGTKEVAAQLGVSPKTIEVHRLNLFAKLKVNNVIELTRIAIKEGLIQL